MFKSLHFLFSVLENKTKPRDGQAKEQNLSLYWLLACFRVILTLIPQTGYIHPDEYFQTIEVIAGE